MFNWEKKGLIFCPEKTFPWMQTHASVPIVRKIEGNFITVLFSTRDFNNKSSIAELVFELESLEVISICNKPILTDSSIGNFDSDGIMGSDLVEIGNSTYLYYIGWNLGKNIPFRNAIGIAELINGNFKKKFNGPILDRSIFDPCFVASCCIVKSDGFYIMYYLSCFKWSNLNLTNQHFYNIKIATSNDGISWNRTGTVAIDFKDEDEYAISVPRVLKDKGLYKMWYSHRGSKNNATYRIGYAESIDGINWVRKDHLMNFETSIDGWDSEMVCYPYLFKVAEMTYMLYNGNGYGKSGFGLARIIN